MLTPSKCAHDALYQLAGESDDEPLALRVDRALKRLRPLRSMRDFDTVIIEMINDACDTNPLPKERARLVADAIEAIFCMWPPTDDLKPRGYL
jgi:hypothetical protein